MHDITADLAPMYLSQVGQAGAVIGVLRADAFIQKLPSPPAPSPVGAHLLRLSFSTWQDLPAYLRSLRKIAEPDMGRRKYEEWCKRIERLCDEKERLLSLSVPLLIEGQMKSVSPKSQDVLLRLVSPVVEGSGSPIHVDRPTPDLPGQVNATILAILHAGRVPFLLTCHSAQTLNTWWSEMEAATVLLLPQLVVHIEPHLPPRHREAMFSALRDELAAWRGQRPTIGEHRDWKWLPPLM
jgi:hypothetical protein